MTAIEVERPTPYAEDDLIDGLREMYSQSRQARSRYEEEWKRNYRLTMNRSAPSVAAAPGIRANEVRPTVDSRIAWMTDQEVEFSLVAAADPFSMWSLVADTLAGQLEAVLNSNLRTEGWKAEIEKMLWNQAMYGPGFLKCGWDGGLEQGLGNITLKSVSPWCLYLDPFASSLDDAAYVIEVHTMTSQEIERRYPEASARAIAEAMRTGDSSVEHLPPDQKAHNQGRGGVKELTPVGTGPVVPPTTWGQQGNAKYHTGASRGVNVYECWFKENYAETIESADPTKGELVVVCDQWRVVVFAGNRVLLDELAENIYHSDRHPYVRFVDIDFGELYGCPILNDLAPCQQAMNTLLAMAQNNIIFTGDPMFIGVKGSGVDRSTFYQKPGQVFEVNGGPGGGQASRPDWLNPPNLPASLMDLVSLYREEMERIAGLSATQRGEVPSGRATDKQVQSGQEAGFVRIRKALRNLENTIGKAGELLAELIVDNYDSARFVAIVGEDGEEGSIKLSARHFYAPTPGKNGKPEFAPLRFSITCNAGASKPTSRGARIMEANNLHDRKVVDDLFVLQAYRVSHAQQVLERKQKQLQEEAKLAETQKAAKDEKGGGSKPPRPS